MKLFFLLTNAAVFCHGLDGNKTEIATASRTAQALTNDTKQLSGMYILYLVVIEHIYFMIVSYQHSRVLLYVYLGTVKCDECASQFYDNGGCSCMQNSENCDAMIPKGCRKCGLDYAIKYCNTQTGMYCIVMCISCSV